jgi:tetratricopeptide (TPR) repeat protein
LARLARDSENSAAAAHVAVWAHLRLGQIHRISAETNAARGEFERALARAESATPSGSESAYLDLAAAHEHLGDLDFDQRRTGDALAHFQRALEHRLAHAIVADRGEVASDYERLGDAYRYLGRLEKARESYRHGLEVYVRLSAQNPDHLMHRRSLSTALERLGDISVLLGQLDEARRYYLQAQDIHRELVDRDRGSVLFRRDLSAALLRLGDLEERERRFAPARESYHEALRLRQELAREDPASFQAGRELASVYEWLGRVHYSQAEYQTALEMYGKSRDHYQGLVDADAGNRTDRMALAVVWLHLGNTYNRLEDHGRARQSYDKGLALHEQLALADPANALGRADLARSYTEAGHLEREGGDLKAARTAYTRALTLRRQLAAADSADPSARGSCLEPLYWLGWVEMKAARPAEARKHFEEADGILGQLRQEKHHQVVHQHQAFASDLRAYLCWCQAAGYLQAGCPDKAAEILEQSLRADPKSPMAAYSAACSYALCLPVLTSGSGSPSFTASTEAVRERFAARALALLRQARAGGYFQDVKNRDQLHRDADLDPLRSRQAFQQFVREVDKAAGGR